MSDQHFLRCNCHNCGSPIEFPAEGVGLKTECPHCGQETLLSESTDAPVAADLPLPPQPYEAETGPSAAVSESHPQRAKKSRLTGALVLFAMAALAVGGWYFFAGPGAGRQDPPVAASPEPKLAKKPEPPVVRPDPSNPAAIPQAAEPVEASNAVESVQTAQKSIEDLKASTVTLEKAKSGSLIHAIGTIKNTSDQQRFGVRVELELTDAAGKPAGKASDYTQVIEPRQEWRFRALVLDPKGSRAVAGRVSSVKEDH